ncbi:MAG: UDP-N-acetylmuramate--alanine ligase [Verrucomicrobiales bacterium]|jgi:UDP-N-acetylmuramate--alanine ligase
MSAVTPIDLSTPQSIHLIAIGGAGMAAIAEVLHGMGHTVRGSDMAASASLERLRSIGIDAIVGHDASNVQSPDIVAKSTAVPASNAEVRAVVESGGRVLHRGELLAAIAAQRKTVAIAGTHGKTTTTSMLSVIAVQAEVDPSFIIGGVVPDLGSGARWGAGEWFVVEADESDGSGFALDHMIGIVTNVEPDHLEFYGSEEAMRRAFADFVAASKVAVVCADDPGAAALAHGSNVVTYGASEGSTYRMSAIERSPEAITFDLHRAEILLGRLRVPMPGLHNARNATAATAAAMEMGLPFSAAQAALANFGGVGRRFDRRGSAGGVDFIDDYAHLPTEVSAALAAGVDTQHDRVVAVFQPHRYSRTEALWQDFEGVFDSADLLVLTDVYASGEAPREGVSGELIVEAVERREGHPPILYHPDRASLAEAIAGVLQPGDLCMSLGAGDLVNLPDELKPLLEHR